MFFVIAAAGYHKHLYDKKKKQAAKKNQKAVCFLMTGSFPVVSGLGCSRFLSLLLLFLDSWSQERFETADMITADR